MNETAVGIHRHWFQFRLRTLLALSFVVALAMPVFSADDQDREHRKRIQLEKTLEFWDYPTTPPELLPRDVRTIEDVRERARATDPPASNIPSFGLDQTSSILAPELNLRERERLEWMRIQAGVDKPLIVCGDHDRQRRKRIQLEKTLNFWDDPGMLPAFFSGPGY